MFGGSGALSVSAGITLVFIFGAILPNWRWVCIGKCFTYVTKTIANLTKFSRKPGDYNDIIIFEIYIMKNSSRLKLKFTFC